MIRLRPEAQEDLRAAYHWYEEQDPGLGEQLVATLDGMYARIEENPRLFQKAHAGFRRAVLRRFPYVVYFTVEPTYILVVAILHGRQDIRRLLERR